LNIKLQEYGEKQSDSNDFVAGKFKDIKKQVHEEFSKSKDKKNGKLKKADLEQQQAINDRLLDELRTTTQILNETLAEKSNLQTQNSSLQSEVDIFKKKLDTYQVKYELAQNEVPCKISSTMVTVLVHFVLLMRNSQQLENILSKID